MKYLRVVLASLLLVTGAIITSSFVAKSFDKAAFIQRCYYFQAPNHSTPPGEAYFKDVVGGDRNLIDFEVLSAGNWLNVFATNAPPADCQDGQFLCAICFNELETSGAGGLTIHEAIFRVWSQYVAFNGLPHNVDIGPTGKTLKVFRQTIVDNH